MEQVATTIAKELNVKIVQVQEAIKLLDDGSTVPFIARYRKERTGGLDDTQLRTLQNKLIYLRELEERKSVILKSIEDQGKLTRDLQLKIINADTKIKLEDLYLPYKPKRRTKAQIAKEAGLEPLATALYENPQLNPEIEAKKYINSEKDIKDVKSALDGARYILIERFSEQADLVAKLRKFLWDNSLIQSQKVADKEIDEKFRDYFDYEEQIKSIVSHRMLAILRARKSGAIRIKISLQNEITSHEDRHPCEQIITDFCKIQHKNRPADDWLATVVSWCWKIKLSPQLEAEIITKAREAAETEAITVFSNNLKDLLLFPPAGMHATIGLDPGLRTGVKVAVLDKTGQCIQHTTIYPHVPQRKWQESLGVLAALCLTHKVKLISIGNGTASRETEKLVSELIKNYPKLNLTKVVVSEAGASVYSASPIAAKELAELDVSIRGAVSIGRRLQDPLAELVKIEPKAIGVGQYQHDVNQLQLARSLQSVVEDCVNMVGVDINTASCELLSYVSGLNQGLAEQIVAHRNKSGVFKDRQQLLEVTRFGNKAFEQSAGFLRIMDADNILDSSAVHPEAYNIVNKISAATNTSVKDMIGDLKFLQCVKPEEFIDNDFGLFTIKDILNELEKPGRDPRPDFKTATFKEDVNNMDDLKDGMILEGSVTNVTKFGAFVDIGVHQDGLVHISALTDKFVSDPRTIVKVGDVVKVKVISVDTGRKRIELSMKLGEYTSDNCSKKVSKEKDARQTEKNKKSANRKSANARTESKPVLGTFGALLLNAKKLRK